LKTQCQTEGIDIWAYCLMTNHIHLIVRPDKKSNLSRAIGETHRNYTRMINFREKWRGYLWQGRFSSFPLDEPWLLNALAYVELNPVKAGMVALPWEYSWSSVHAHLAGKDNLGIVDTSWLSKHLIADWKTYLLEALANNDKEFQQHERTGRPLGDDAFIKKAETLLGRCLMKKKPGPKPKKSQ